MNKDATSRGRPEDLPAIAGGTPVRPAENPLIFGAPVIGEAEISSVCECLRSRWIGPGERVEQFEQEFARYKAASHAAAVSSGSAAIHLSLAALGIGAGDEVLAPAMTFASTIHSIIHVGATPVLVDCQQTTFNMDPEALEQSVTEQTRAILVVHMCGRCCEMDPILEISRNHDLCVIEDCAHAIEAHFHGVPAGLMGDLGCFSFYPTKNITTGDGGMVIGQDEQLIERIKTLSLHGMTRSTWDRYAHGKSGYEFAEAGFKYNMTDIAAALGLAQLPEIEQRWKRREEIWHTYTDRLRELPLVLPPPAEPETRHAYHLYSVLLVPEKLGVGRETVLTALRAENIGVGIHFVPVHMQPYYRQWFGFRQSDFPNAAFVGKRTLSIPLAPDLTEDDVSDVCTALTRVLSYYASSGESLGQVQQEPNKGTVDEAKGDTVSVDESGLRTPPK